MSTMRLPAQHKMRVHGKELLGHFSFSYVPIQHGTKVIAAIDLSAGSGKGNADVGKRRLGTLNALRLLKLPIIDIVDVNGVNFKNKLEAAGYEFPIDPSKLSHKSFMDIFKVAMSRESDSSRRLIVRIRVPSDKIAEDLLSMLTSKEPVPLKVPKTPPASKAAELKQTLTIEADFGRRKFDIPLKDLVSICKGKVIEQINLHTIR